MLLFNSNFPAHLLTADVCMCVCKGECFTLLCLILSPKSVQLILIINYFFSVLFDTATVCRVKGGAIQYYLLCFLVSFIFFPFFWQFRRTLLNEDNSVVADSRGAISNFWAEDATSKVSRDRFYFPLLQSPLSSIHSPQKEK